MCSTACQRGGRNPVPDSSPKHLSVVSNGAYYTIDRGVDPHYYFSKAESYFDREALTDYINELK